jgi:hypothetical protein
VLGIDGSKVLRPNRPAVIRELGPVSWSNQPVSEGQHAYGIASVRYEVFNRMALDSTLSQARADEVDLAIEPLK